MKAFKYRLSPTKGQKKKLEWTLDRCRELYNAALQERKEAYKYAGKSISKYEQMRDLTIIRQEIRPEYQEIGSHVLQDVLKRLDQAYQAFFRRVKQGQKPGHPRFLGKHRYDSFCFPDASGWKLEGNRLHLSKIGSIKMKLHRAVQGTIKTCTIKREGDFWYVTFACEVEASPRLPDIDEAVGIDLGLHHFAALSTGDLIENPRHYRRAEKKLARMQQRMSHKKRGSHRRRKVVKQLSKAYRKVRNQRADYLHKWSRWLVDTYETFVFEDLQPANMSRRPKPVQDENGVYLPNRASQKAGMNKSILDAGWSLFVGYCVHKAENAGTHVLFVKPHKTSQICCGCGTVKKKDLSERWHSCECGVELDRDVNAAKNILRLGQSLQGTRP